MKKEVLIVFILLIGIHSVLALTTVPEDEGLVPKTSGTMNTISSLLNPPISQEVETREFILPKEVRVSGATPAAECGSAPTDGCTITTNTTFNPGTYTVQNGIKINGSNIVLNCNGAILDGLNSDLASLLWVLPGNNIEIKNCKIRNNNRPAIYAKLVNNLNINNNIIESVFGGVQIGSLYDTNSGTNFSARNNTILNSPLFGFIFFGLSNGLIENNTINISSIRSGLPEVKWGAVIGIDTSNFTIKNNTIRNSSTANYSDIIIQNAACDINIIGNDIQNSYRGILLDNAKARGICQKFISIESNTIKKIDRQGIYSLNVYPSPDGIKQYETMIKNNKFYDIFEGSIFVKKAARNIQIRDNYFYDNTRGTGFNSGVWLFGNATNVTIENNSGTQFAYDSTGFHYGIYIDNHPQLLDGPNKNITVKNNNFTKYVIGVLIRDPGAVNIRVLSNDFRSNFAGVDLEGTQNIKVSRNTLVNNIFGLGIVNSVNNIKVFLNNIYGSTSYNINSNVVMEASYQSLGNYWGHTNSPCFISGTDSTGPVQDSFPICNLISFLEINTSSPAWYFVSQNLNSNRKVYEGHMYSLQGEDFSTNQFEIIQTFLNGNADQYVPGNPFNDLQWMYPHNGYWIKIIEKPEEGFIPFGFKPVVCSLNLNSGIHWIGYWQNNPEATSGALSSVAGNYDYIRTFENGAWKTYDPDLIPFSDLTEMKPGNGYLIKMLNSDTLDYCL